MYHPSTAVIGSGIAGMATAWLLDRRNPVQLFEAGPRLGGHTHTVEVDDPGGPLAVDTGFIVFNPENYPNLTALFEHLQVASDDTDMSFAVSLDGGRLEYSGSDLNGLFAQRVNLLRPDFHRMLLDILRFNRAARSLARGERSDARGDTLGEFLDRLRMGRAMRAHYLLPMAAAIWSCSTSSMLDFPARSMARFLDNHGLLNINDRPQWRTVRGGSQRYVERLCAGFQDRVHLGDPVCEVRRLDAGVELRTRSGQRARFDQVVIATHADQALGMLHQPRDEEAALLSRFGYQDNVAVLHRDAALMPRRRGVWSAWNYLARSGGAMADRVSVSYWMNCLQRLHSSRDYFVSLNPLVDPDPALEDYRTEFAHPVFDAAAVAAQADLHRLQGQGGLWFCGSYFGYGFHEDALSAGLRVAADLGAPPPWWREEGRRERTARDETLPLAAAARISAGALP
jgi:predicted NAD/FAD-binding protein